jgi:hypothetical protein
MFRSRFWRNSNHVVLRRLATWPLLFCTFLHPISKALSRTLNSRFTSLQFRFGENGGTSFYFPASRPSQVKLLVSEDHVNGLFSKGPAQAKKMITPRLSCDFWTSGSSFDRKSIGLIPHFPGFSAEVAHGFLWADSLIQTDGKGRSSADLFGSDSAMDFKSIQVKSSQVKSSFKSRMKRCAFSKWKEHSKNRHLSFLWCCSGFSVFQVGWSHCSYFPSSFFISFCFLIWNFRKKSCTF